MSITITPSVQLTRPLKLTKFRENSKDSVVYITDFHKVEAPMQVTVTSELPVPRKGNAGTVKTTLNARVAVDIGTPTEPKIVPVICKVSTSIPVGTTKDDRRLANDMVVSMLQQADVDFNKLFYTGILPE